MIDVNSQPIRLKNLALDRYNFNIIYTNIIHNNEIMTTSLFVVDDEVESDYFHSKETNIKRFKRYSVDLCCYLLRKGVKITFLDGSEKEISKFSPPLYNKFYSKLNT